MPESEPPPFDLPRINVPVLRKAVRSFQSYLEYLPSHALEVERRRASGK